MINCHLIIYYHEHVQGTKYRALLDESSYRKYGAAKVHYQPSKSTDNVSEKRVKALRIGEMYLC